MSALTSETGLLPALSGDWEETKFVPGPLEAVWDQTADGAHVVCLEDAGDGQTRFAWDGVAGRSFELIPQANGNPLIWSPDLRRVAYYGSRDGTFFVGIDGTEIGPLDGVTRSVPPTFSADGSRVAFGYFIDPFEIRLMVDGEILGDWKPAPRPPVFSPDGTHLAFAAESRRLERGDPTDGYHQWIVLDGVDGPEANGIPLDPASVQFSPDSRRFLYAQVIDDGMRLVIDGQAGATYPNIGFPTWSPDSRRLVYAAGSKDRFTLIEDGTGRGSPYWRIGPPVFSPDSTRLGFFGMRAKNRGVAVIDGFEGPEHVDFWGNVEFSPDSRRVGYLAMSKSGGFLSRSTTAHLVIDGSIGADWDEVNGNVHFSADSRRIAFPARRGKAWHMVVDGQPGPAFEEVGAARWSATGRLGYIAKTSARGTDRYRVIVDGIATPEMDFPSAVSPGESFLFSPDGNHVATVGSFEDIWRPVVDDRIGPGGLGATNFRFEDDVMHVLVSGLDGAREFVTHL